MAFSFLVQSSQLFKDFNIYLHPDHFPPFRKMLMIPLGHLLLDRYLIDFVELVVDSQHLELS
jgi:hypothetical protein